MQFELQYPVSVSATDTANLPKFPVQPPFLESSKYNVSSLLGTVRNV
jgi:hypothetical protein